MTASRPEGQRKHSPTEFGSGHPQPHRGASSSYEAAPAAILCSTWFRAHPDRPSLAVFGPLVRALLAALSASPAPDLLDRWLASAADRSKSAMANVIFFSRDALCFPEGFAFRPGNHVLVHLMTVFKLEIASVPTASRNEAFTSSSGLLPGALGACPVLRPRQQRITRLPGFQRLKPLTRRLPPCWGHTDSIIPLSTPAATPPVIGYISRTSLLAPDPRFSTGSGAELRVGDGRLDGGDQACPAFHSAPDSNPQLPGGCIAQHVMQKRQAEISKARHASTPKKNRKKLER